MIDLRAKEWAQLFECAGLSDGMYADGECPSCHRQKFDLDAVNFLFVCRACGLAGDFGDLEPYWRPANAFRSVAELANRPELLKAPDQTLPRFGYKGRLVVLAAPDKAGKSTLAAEGAAALSRGARFLGERTKVGRSVLVGLEEAPADAVRRFVNLNADLEQLQLITRPTADVREQLRALLTAWPAELVVIDSLAEYARLVMGHAPSDGDNAGWGAVVRPLVSLAREFDTAVLVLHHVRKSDGKYRGATEIAAAADALLEMSVSQTDDTLRFVTGRGRWAVEQFACALVEGRYEMIGGEVSVREQILAYLEKNPRSPMLAVRQAVRAKTGTVVDTVNDLLAAGDVVDLGTENRRAFVVPGFDLLGKIGADG